MFLRQGSTDRRSPKDFTWSAEYRPFWALKADVVLISPKVKQHHESGENSYQPPLSLRQHLNDVGHPDNTRPIQTQTVSPAPGLSRDSPRGVPMQRGTKDYTKRHVVK